MFKTKLEIKQKNYSEKLKFFFINRSVNINNKDTSKKVEKIIKNVRERGDSAVIEYTNKFDNRKLVDTSDFLFTKEHLKKSRENLDTDLLEAMRFSFKRIIKFHKTCLGNKSTTLPNSEVARSFRPLDEVAIYVPGGKASYISTVLMAAGPARAAGVKKLILTSPCPNNKFNPALLAAASIAGIEYVYSIGGAQAIAAFALGTETISKVQKIVGPGNNYVTEAKRQLFGSVGIDSLSGPSEIVIIADETSNPFSIAFDLMAQAEHDEFASSILIASDIGIINEVTKIIKNEISKLSRSKIISKSFSNNGALIEVENCFKAIDLANQIAPEHLHLVTKNAKKLVKSVKTAGMVLVGEDSANGLSDYVLGPSHIIPTGGTSRFSSPLCVEDFLLGFSYIELEVKGNEDEYNELLGTAILLAEAEGLTAHSQSLLLRKKN